MDFVNQIVKLDNSFYRAYPHSQYPEILYKQNRAYNCFIFELWDDIFVCIPYRTEVKHKYAYKFKNSARSKDHKSALDYTKAVIIKDTSYISSSPAVIDQDEYNETMNNINKIAIEIREFVNSYIDYHKSMGKISLQEYKRRYSCSPLQYFHNELNIR
ncbi:MAG: hypothetical protein IJ062_00645 [Firmicutes bacterium]|nr:hypothetical protein [Bacillota bacterium]